MKQRQYYLDNLRIFLTLLVIVHHTAITYGAGGSWYFEDVDKTEMTVSIVLLTLFTAINQSFFMGLFFFLSGYFTPTSYDRKGPTKFLLDRFIRLGIPLAVFHFVLGPYVAYLAGSGGDRSYASFYQDEVLSFTTVHFGPLWFVETLLYFAIAYTVWRVLTKRLSLQDTLHIPLPTTRTLLLIAAVLGLAAFAVRLVFPVGATILGLQLGYFPAYIILFIAGILAQRQQWLSSITQASARTWKRIVWVTAPILPIALIATGALDGNMHFEGGINFQAFVYAMWEPFLGFGIIIYLLHRFSERHNTSSPLKRKMSEAAYTAYIIHPIIIVAISLLFVGTTLPPTIKFVAVSAASVVLCFATASLFRRIPFADRIL